MQSIHTLLKLAQLSHTGHVTRMPDEHLPKKILYGELQVGKRSHGGQKKQYKDNFKASLKFVCVEVLRPSQPNGVMSSAVSLSNHTFIGQA